MSYEVDELDCKIKELQQALAEKDREIEEIRTLLGCHPAHIADTIRDLTSKTDQIPNIDRVRIAESNLRELREADHALMGQAVRFAERLSVFAQQYPEGDEACEFLASPKVRAWREHKEGTK